MTGLERSSVVLAVYPNTRGFAFVLFENGLSLTDWGAKELRGVEKNALCLARVESLFVRYRPHILVLQNTLDKNTRRADRIAALNADIADLGTEYGVDVRAYSRAEILSAFAAFGAQTKHDIARVIAANVTELVRYVPPRRKAWMAESARMAIFDAAALALAYLSSQGHGFANGRDRERG